MSVAVCIIADSRERERVLRWASDLADTGLVEFPDPWWSLRPEQRLPTTQRLEQIQACDVVWVLWPSLTSIPSAVQLGAVLMLHVNHHAYPTLLVSGAGIPMDFVPTAELVSREDVVAFERIASKARHLQALAEVP
jgi:hypothetical protein